MCYLDSYTEGFNKEYSIKGVLRLTRNEARGEVNK